jgi:hypothetical protein
MLVDGLLCLSLMRRMLPPYRGSTIMAVITSHMATISRLTAMVRTAIDTSRQQAGLLSSNGHLRYLQLILLGECCYVPRLTSSSLSARRWLEAHAKHIRQQMCQELSWLTPLHTRQAMKCYKP